jgi:hypothetical protein
MNVVVMGLDTLVVDLPAEFEVGQTVSISPRANMEVSNGSGGSVALTPGITMTGEVVAKD